MRRIFLLRRHPYLPRIAFPAKRKFGGAIEEDTVNLQGCLQINLHRQRVAIANHFIRNDIAAFNGFMVIIGLYGDIITQHIPPSPFRCNAAP